MQFRAIFGELEGKDSIVCLVLRYKGVERGSSVVVGDRWEAQAHEAIREKLVFGKSVRISECRAHCLVLSLEKSMLENAALREKREDTHSQTGDPNYILKLKAHDGRAIAVLETKRL